MREGLRKAAAYAALMTRLAAIFAIVLIAKWDCSRDGHKFSTSGKWKSCSACGYTTKA